MAGFLSGFNQGWGLADQQIRQNKADERYDAAQAKEEERYNEGIKYRDKVRQEETDYRTKRDEVNDKRAKETSERADKQLKLQQDQYFRQVQKDEEEKRKQYINDTADVAWREYNSTGDFSQATFDKLRDAFDGTAYDIDQFVNPEYIHQLDNVETFMKNPAQINTPEGQQFFSTLYSKELADGEMPEGGVSRRFNKATYKDGNIQLFVDTLDANGNVIDTSPITDDRTAGGNPRNFSFDEISDSVMAKKFAATSIMANKDLSQKIMARVNSASGRTDNLNTDIAGIDKPALEVLKNLNENYAKARFGYKNSYGETVEPDLEMASTIKTEMDNMISQNPRLQRYFPNQGGQQQPQRTPEETQQTLQQLDGIEFNIPDSTVPPEKFKADLMQKYKNGEISQQDLTQIVQTYGSKGNAQATDYDGIANSITTEDGVFRGNAAYLDPMENLRHFKETGKPLTVVEPSYDLNQEASDRFGIQQRTSRGY